MKRANSVELLHDDNYPHQRLEEEEEKREASCQSASNSPVPPRRAVWDPPALDPRTIDPHAFHTLPRSRPKKPVPKPKTRHVYAMVSKTHDGSSQESPMKGSKGTPPSPLPKPKRGKRGEGGSREGSPRVEKPRKLGAPATSFDMPRLEVVEPENAFPLPPPPVLPASLETSSADTSSADKSTREEDTLSLQGLPSSEILHTSADDGQIYAVINKKKKKKDSAMKRSRSDETPEQPPPGKTPEESSVGIVVEGGEGGSKLGGEEGKTEKKKPPPKPPRMKPPKPAPYSPRAGSPLPALLSGDDRSSSPLLSPHSSCSPCSPNTSPEPPPPIPSRSPAGQQTSVVAGELGIASLALQLPLPPSPLTPTPLTPTPLTPTPLTPSTLTPSSPHIAGMCMCSAHEIP